VQRLIHKISTAMRAILSAERLYVLSLGSQAANSHVHWHLSPLPAGVPLEDQQYRALMHEYGVVVSTEEELESYAKQLAVIVRQATV